jgi:hypothetical protein
MILDSIPIWAFFFGTIVIVMGFIEAGYALGRGAHRKSKDEMEGPVSGVSGGVLALTAFILAFTFAIVSGRFDARKELVRDDANAIRTAYFRADFLPEPDLAQSKQLMKVYLDRRVAFAQAGNIGRETALQWYSESEVIHRRLWEIAVANARRDMNSDVAALYIEALNEMFDVHALRVEVGLQARIPVSIWIALFSLTALGMLSVGYHAGIAGSKRSKATLILATSFGLVIAIIASMDRPNGFIQATQRPLVHLQAFIASEK